MKIDVQQWGFIKTFYLMLISTCLISLIGCNDSGWVDPSEDLKLQQAKSKWASNKTDYYQMNTQRSCFCLDEYTAPMAVKIFNNTKLSGINLLNNEPISEVVLESVKSVDDLFALIQNAIDEQVDAIEVTYNMTLGYPESIFIDYSFTTADEEFRVTISELSFYQGQYALEDTQWKMTSFNTIAGPQPLVEGSEITLSFDNDAFYQLSGNAGCNDYGGSFALDDADNSIMISISFVTEMNCGSPIMAQEQGYLDQLELVQQYAIDGTSLSLVIGADNVFQFELIN